MNDVTLSVKDMIMLECYIITPIWQKNSVYIFRNNDNQHVHFVVLHCAFKKETLPKAKQTHEVIAFTEVFFKGRSPEEKKVKKFFGT